MYLQTCYYNRAGGMIWDCLIPERKRIRCICRKGQDAAGAAVIYNGDRYWYLKGNLYCEKCGRRKLDDDEMIFALTMEDD